MKEKRDESHFILWTVAKDGFATVGLAVGLPMGGGSQGRCNLVLQLTAVALRHLAGNMIAWYSSSKYKGPSEVFSAGERKLPSM